jgi:hypothetical protein
MSEEKKKLDPKKREIIKDIEELAETMRVSVRTIYRWKKKGMPVTEDGYYDFISVMLWNKKRLGLIPTTEKDGEPHWRMMNVKNKALILGLKVKTLEGKLLPKEEVKLREFMRVMEIKNTFLNLPRIIAPELAMKNPEEIEVILYNAISKAVDDFERSGKAYLDGKGCNYNWYYED